MPRKRRPLDRDGGVLRDASLIVIASEDTHAVERYFRRFKTRKVQFFTIPTQDGRSSPEAVFERLKAAKAEFAEAEGDSYWLCIDRDAWKAHVLGDAVHQAAQQGYQIAVSDPCFEIWILLHYEGPSDTFSNCKEVIGRLKNLLGGYTKRCCQIAELREQHVHDAMRRAKSLDDESNTGNKTGVYRILDELLKRDRIELS